MCGTFRCRRIVGVMMTARDVRQATAKRFHVNRFAQTAECQAQKGNCPYAENRHFATREEANAYALSVQRVMAVPAVHRRGGRPSGEEAVSFDTAETYLTARNRLFSRAESGDLYEGVSPTQHVAERMTNAIGFFRRRSNTFAMRSAAKAVMWKTGRFRTKGRSVSVDDTVRAASYVHSVKDSRNIMLHDMQQQAVEDGVEGKFKFARPWASGTVTVKKDQFNMRAFEELPEKTRQLAMVDKYAFSVDRAREVLTPQQFSEVTRTTTVFDPVYDPARAEADTVAPGELGARAGEGSEQAGRWGAVEAFGDSYDRWNEGGKLVDSTKAQKDGQDVIKGAVSGSVTPDRSVFVPGKGRWSGGLVSQRVTVSAQDATSKLTRDQLAQISLRTRVFSEEAARAHLDDRSLSKIFSATTVSAVVRLVDPAKKKAAAEKKKA